MIKRILILLTVILLCSVAHAEEHPFSIRVEYSFTPDITLSPKSITLHIDGVSVWEGDYKENVFDANFIATNGTHDFTMLIGYEDGIESPKSPVYSFSLGFIPVVKDFRLKDTI